MKYYKGMGRPYIYVAFPKEKEEETVEVLELLNKEGVLFWCAKENDKKDRRRIMCANAVLLFVSEDFLLDESFERIVNCAVRNNKNILTVFDSKGKLDRWAHMQLDCAQALFASDYPDREAFVEKLKGSEIFRTMRVTRQQKRVQRRRAFIAVAAPLLSAAIAFFAIINPLLIKPQQKLVEDITANYVNRGLTVEELEKVKQVVVMGGTVLGENVKSVHFEKNWESEGFIASIDYEDGSHQEVLITESGNITDISGLSYLKNVQNVLLLSQKIKDISPLFEDTGIVSLQLDNNPLDSIEGISSLQKLEDLHLSYTNVTNIDELTECSNLRALNIDGTPIEQLPDISSMKKLESVSLNDSLVREIPYLGRRSGFAISCTGMPNTITDYSFLKDISHFYYLNVQVDDTVDNLAQNIQNKRFDELSLAGPHMESLDELGNITFTYLSRLSICWDDQLVSIEGIEKWNNLGSVSLRHVEHVDDLTPLLKLPYLKEIVLSNDMRPLAEEQLGEFKGTIIYAD